MLMAIQRPGEAIRILISDADDPSEQWPYDGSVVAEAFSVAGPAFNGWLVCGATSFPYTAQESITGRFSEDGRTMVGEEVDSYSLTTGASLIYRSDWIAARID
jgi:hypothetical protein